MNKQIKYRQPIFADGKFSKFHYWGVNINQGAELANVGWLTFKVDVTDPKDSQEFTGAEDMNGKEIYLGDINQDGGKVEWNNDDSSFVWSYKIQGIEDVMPFESEHTWCKIIANNFKMLK